jgi:hypothetical protein
VCVTNSEGGSDAERKVQEQTLCVRVLLSMLESKLTSFIGVVQSCLLLVPKLGPGYLERERCVFVCARVCALVDGTDGSI